jgi:uncharacterized C2H2 Zn-finger protein
VPGLLPGPGKQWADHLFLPHHRLHLLLQPGHQGEGNFSSRENDQEEKPGPSTPRRTLLRKEEFIKKKSEISSDLEATSLSEAIFECEHCASSFKTENGLKIHIGKSHKSLKSSLSPKKVHENSEETSLTVSPLRDTRREEQEAEKEEEAPSLPGELVKLHDTTKEKIDLSPKKDDYPHPQKCCYEPCDLYFENKTEYAGHVLKHMKQGD